MNYFLNAALNQIVPMHNGNPTWDECQKHTKGIEELAASLMNYLGCWDVANLVEELANLYKEAYSGNDADELDEPDEKLLNYFYED